MSHRKKTHIIEPYGEEVTSQVLEKFTTLFWKVGSAFAKNQYFIRPLLAAIRAASLWGYVSTSAAYLEIKNVLLVLCKIARALSDNT